MTPQAAEDALRRLVIAVERWLDKPGCNDSQRRLAVEKLRRAAELAREELK